MENLKVRTEDIDDLAKFTRFSFADLLRQISQLRWLIWAITVIALCTVGSVLTAVFLPGSRAVLLGEDGIIETGGAVCLASVVLLAGSAAIVSGPRAAFLLGGLFGLVELMDETSFGARILGFQPPALYGGGELDGVHDLLILAYRLLGDLSPSLGWALIGLILAVSLGTLLFALRVVWNTRIDARWPRLSNHVLIFLHVGLIGVAQVVDVATTSRTFSAVEELLEFNAAVLLLFYVAQQVVETTRRSRSGRSRP
ncbi:hypothetical protein EV128_109122 [Rhizobium azibense]|nr:hypothetical protein EV128_109122 [Rhizobium azibense]